MESCAHLRAPAHAPPRCGPAPDHVVQFYDTDDYVAKPEAARGMSFRSDQLRRGGSGDVQASRTFRISAMRSSGRHGLAMKPSKPACFAF